MNRLVAHELLYYINIKYDSQGSYDFARKKSPTTLQGHTDVRNYHVRIDIMEFNRPLYR